ncbi:MAG: type VI secretion system tip protein VgrG [Candidatus Eisenbacteria bacterium]|uniref:Type VI secretion system tip protein VgrG n=1 Tax=Eiseniibacteriota bacterium TaxID=2212470 RepID=A0A948RXG0_UNCEI|nr:type VI secretion system tip protein VgrG [Candidatus Eisenbacteria bacterium]MBU1948370.1 type VI secretion system tip protein VgrG [Candidatus Eisenbacteria bacterium]MBU2692825.1 type VI secretion system tip protein VgrG [Candidatus Eisenbacteria bacterium]
MPIPEGVYFAFTAGQLEPSTFNVFGIRGHEAISEPYRFVIELGSSDPDVDATQIIQHPATIEIRRNDDIVQIHGVVLSFEFLEYGKEWKQYHYRAVVVPRLSLLELTSQSRIFLDKDVKTIITEVLEDHGLGAGEDFSIELSETYAVSEYVSQYQENDLNFVQRLMEHEGIFYYFEQGDEHEKLIIADNMSIHTEIPCDDPTLLYREPKGMEPGGETITSLTMRQKALPAEVILKDYNYRTPSKELKSSADILSDGHGKVMEYGAHFKDQSEGDRLAKVRAEEILSQQKIFYGQSGVRACRCGYKFTLEDHYRDSFDIEYLLTEVEHFGQQPSGLGSAALGESGEASYRNEITAIPADVPFRPARRAPRPKFTGTMNAKVDAGGSGQYAEIDDQGRYKIKLPFDLSNLKDGKASRYMRMAQPYAGADYGMHFPLHKGTEVLITFADGDPDRPIIASAVPNPETSTHINSDNQTKAGFVTGGGNMMMMEDTDGSQRIVMGSGDGKTMLRMGSGSDPGVQINWETGGLGAVQGALTSIIDKMMISISVGSWTESAIRAMLTSGLDKGRRSIKDDTLKQGVQSLSKVLDSLLKVLMYKHGIKAGTVLGSTAGQLFAKPGLSLTSHADGSCALKMNKYDATSSGGTIAIDATVAIGLGARFLWLISEMDTHIGSGRAIEMYADGKIYIATPGWKKGPKSTVSMKPEGEITVSGKKFVETNSEEEIRLLTPKKKGGSRLTMKKDGETKLETDKSVSIFTKQKDGKIVLEAEKEICFKVGDNEIKLEKDSISIVTKKTKIKADKSGKIELEAEEEFNIDTKKLVEESDTKIKSSCSTFDFTGSTFKFGSTITAKK